MLEGFHRIERDLGGGNTAISCSNGRVSFTYYRRVGNPRYYLDGNAMGITEFESHVRTLNAVGVPTTEDDVERWLQPLIDRCEDPDNNLP